MTNKIYRRRSNLNTAVWLIGLGILWLTDLWWPGILILIGISMLIRAVTLPVRRDDAIPSIQEPAAEVETPGESENDLWAKEDKISETPVFAARSFEKNEALLPAQCPACGGPVAENAHSVDWANARTVMCPFCSNWLSL